MWNARAEMPGPGDIFAVCCQSYSPNGMTRYGRYTHLDDMSALTQWTKDAVYHNITVLETAKPRKEILNTVAETFPAYDVLVLWSRKEYELFRQAMHDCGHRLCTAKVVLLEELLGAVVRPRKRGRVPFQQVLRAFHVQTTRETFYQPKYRAGFLLELWDRVSQLAAQSEEWTQDKHRPPAGMQSSRPDGRTALYAAGASGRCCPLQRLPKEEGAVSLGDGAAAHSEVPASRRCSGDAAELSAGTEAVLPGGRPAKALP